MFAVGLDAAGDTEDLVLVDAGAYDADGMAAIAVQMDSYGLNTVINNGLIAAYGGGARVAISSGPYGIADIVNYGDIIGSIQTGNYADSLYNDNYWLALQSSDFGDGDDVIVNHLKLPASTVAMLEHNLLLCHLGNSRESALIIDDQTRRYEEDASGTIAALRRQKELAVELKHALLAGDLDGFGALLGDVWRVKQEMSPLIATDVATATYDTAMRAGALGGKMTGAGGGGHMLFYAPFERRFEVAQALRDTGLTVADIALDDAGLQTWTHA